MPINVEQVVAMRVVPIISLGFEEAAALLRAITVVGIS